MAFFITTNKGGGSHSTALQITYDPTYAGSPPLIDGSPPITNVQDAIDALAVLLSGKADSAHVHTLAHITDSGALAALNKVQDSHVDSEVATDGHVLTADGAGNATWEAIDVGSISHGDLDNLNVDDHTMYHTDARGDIRYYTKAQLNNGVLDTRYYTETETDALLAGKSDTGHTHVLANITDSGALAALNKVQDSHIDSESATDGYVLTANGFGDASWELPDYTTNHSLLDNLLVDTHTQYALADGSRGAFLKAVVDDTTPELGGDLSVNSFKITSTSNGDIALEPDGNGKVTITSAATNNTLQITSVQPGIELYDTPSGDIVRIVNMNGDMRLTAANYVDAIRIKETTGYVQIGSGVLQSNVVNNSNVIGFELDTLDQLTAAGTKTLVVKNFGTTVLSIDKDGETQLPYYTTNGFVKTSAGDGTLTIATTIDAGEISSGSATDGYVLTADGVGGADWEPVAADFIDLGDTPPSYAGHANKIVKVNGTEDGLIFALSDATVVWGDITGTLSNQTDLQNALDLKLETVTASDVDSEAATNGYVLTANGGGGATWEEGGGGDASEITYSPGSPNGFASPLPTTVEDALNQLAAGEIGGNYLENIVEDLTPQLGGDLDVNSQKITSASDGDVWIKPDGTGVPIVTELHFEDPDTPDTKFSDSYIKVELTTIGGIVKNAGNLIGPWSMAGLAFENNIIYNVAEIQFPATGTAQIRPASLSAPTLSPTDVIISSGNATLAPHPIFGDDEGGDLTLKAGDSSPGSGDGGDAYLLAGSGVDNHGTVYIGSSQTAEVDIGASTIKLSALTTDGIVTTTNGDGTLAIGTLDADSVDYTPGSPNNFPSPSPTTVQEAIDYLAQPGSDDGLQHVVEDLTPQLGGDLDVQTYKIFSSAAGGDIILEPGISAAVGIGTTDPNDDSMIEIRSTTTKKGLYVTQPNFSDDYAVDIRGNSSDAALYVVQLEANSIAGYFKSNTSSSKPLHVSGHSSQSADLFEVEKGSTNIFRIKADGTTVISTGLLESEVLDGASAVAYNLDTAYTLSTAGSKLLSIKNNGDELVYIEPAGELTFKSSAASPGFTIFDRPGTPGRQLVFTGNDGTYSLFNVATTGATPASPKLAGIALWEVGIDEAVNSTQFQLQNSPDYDAVIFTQKYGTGTSKTISLHTEWDQASTPTQLVLNTDGTIRIGNYTTDGFVKTSAGDGTLIVGTGDASDIEYTTSLSPDPWASPSPTTVQEALDALADQDHNHDGDYLKNVIEDATPQLGGDLDVDSKYIKSIGGSDINILSANDINITATGESIRFTLGGAFPGLGGLHGVDNWFAGFTRLEQFEELFCVTGYDGLVSDDAHMVFGVEKSKTDKDGSTYLIAPSAFDTAVNFKNGSHVHIEAGYGAATTGGNGGNVYLNAGAAGAGWTDGHVYIGTTNTDLVEIGASTIKLSALTTDGIVTTTNGDGTLAIGTLDADSVDYTPGSPNNFPSPEPTTVQEAIDYLAQPGSDDGLQHVVEDLTPQLGGDLDLNNQKIYTEDHTANFESGVADGATSDAFDFDTTNNLATSGAKIARFSNNGVSKAYIDKDGDGYFAGTLESNGVAYLGTSAYNGVACYFGQDKSTARVYVTSGGNNMYVLADTVKVGRSGYELSHNTSGISWDRRATTFNVTTQGGWSGSSYPSHIRITPGTPNSGYTILEGSHVYVEGGDSRQSGTGDMHGGNLYLRGGPNYDTGHDGYVYIGDTNTDMVDIGAPTVKLSQLTTDGFVKTSNTDGTLIVDTIDAGDVEYTPPSPNQYGSPAPTTVQEALDAIAEGGTGLDHVVEDPTPQLGGDLDVNGQKIISVSDGDIIIEPDGTGNVGVGTDTPNAKLNVGDALTSPLTNLSIGVNRALSTYNGMEFQSNGSRRSYLSISNTPTFRLIQSTNNAINVSAGGLISREGSGDLDITLTPLNSGVVKISTYTTNGFLKTSAGDGTIIVDDVIDASEIAYDNGSPETLGCSPSPANVQDAIDCLAEEKANKVDVPHIYYQEAEPTGAKVGDIWIW